MSAPPRLIYLQIGDDYEGEYTDEATWCADKIHNTDIAYVLHSDYDELQAKLDSALLDKGLSEVMKSQMNARIQNCEAALEERDQQLMDAQAKLAEAESLAAARFKRIQIDRRRYQEAERLNKVALEAMKYHTEQTRPIQRTIDAIKELEKP